MNRSRSIALVLLVLVSSVGGTVAFSGGAAAGTDGYTVTTCDNWGERAMGGLVGFNLGGISGATGDLNPCIAQNNQVTDVDTAAEAKRRIAQLAMEDRRYWESFETMWDEYSDRLSGPAFLDAKTKFIGAMKNNSTEIHAVTLGREAAHGRIANQQRELWKYYRSMMNAVGTLESQAEDEQVRNESLRIGKINQTTNEPEWGYTYLNQSKYVVYPTTNVTLADGSMVVLSAPYKGEIGNTTDRLNPIEDDVLVQVFDPESGGWESVINTGALNPIRSFNYSFTGTDSTPWTDFTLGDYLIQMQESDGSLRISDSNGPITTKSVSSDGNITIEFGKGETVIRTNGNNFYTISKEFAPTDIAFHNEGNTGSWGDIQKDSSSVVTGYTNEFAEKHNYLETVDNNVIDALGDSSSGYLNDVYNNVQMGNINWSDAYTAIEKIQMSAGDEDFGADNMVRFYYEALGFGGPNTVNTESSVSLTVHSGADVDGTTITSNKTLSGGVYTATAPPNGTWTTGDTYNITDDFNGSTIHVVTQKTVSTTENGTTTYRVVTDDVAINSGTVTVGEITNTNGTVIETVDQTSRDPRSTNVSALTAQINELQDTIEQLRETNLANDGTTSGGDGGVTIDFGFGGLFDWIPSFSISTPWNFISANLGGIALLGGGLALAVGLVFAGPELAIGALKKLGDSVVELSGVRDHD